MSWLPELHKQPAVSRLVIAAPKCSVKPLSKALISILRLIFKQIKVYKKCSYFSSVKSFWTVLNNKPVIDAIDKINTIKNLHSVSTFDFSTLYTDTKHKKLKFVLRESVNLYFKGGSGNYIAVRNFWARCFDDKKNYNILFDKGNLKLAINRLIDNYYLVLEIQPLDKQLG